MQQLKRMAAAAGADLDVARCDLDADAVRALVRGWGRRPPDAVCAMNDEYAIAIVTALVDAKIRVPDDVAVIGVDDIPFGAYVTPSLTTVAADFTSFAAGVAATVAAVLDDPGARVELPRAEPRLVVRESA